MRLWHYELIRNSLLPKSQLLAQWRELNSIFKKQDNHILINYIYSYDKKYLKYYTDLVIQDMKKRNYKIKSYENYYKYFDLDLQNDNQILLFKEHNKDYLDICYYNLKEKYIRGQKDSSKIEFEKLNKRTDTVEKNNSKEDILRSEMELL